MIVKRSSIHNTSSVANLLMEVLEYVAMTGANYVPAFYKRNVDDSILCLPKTKVEYAEQSSNPFHPDIHFIVEKEEQSKLSGYKDDI